MSDSATAPDGRDHPTLPPTTLPWVGHDRDAPGTPVPQFFGEYEILEELGRGGMGVVYKARDPGLDRFVALKMVLPGSHADEKELRRFHSEAAAAARLKHPNIVAVHRVGVLDGRHFYSMDFIDGPTLTQRLAGGPLPGRVAARYLAAVARAIQHAHDHGILHRDLKPGNILLDAADQPRVADFGLAKQLDADAGQTRTGAVLGTPSYMAPEQASGRKDLGPACDVYGLGALLYELLTGRPPFRAETPFDTLLQVIDREPAPPRLLNAKVDRDLETICLKCLSKSPADRYPGAEAVALDLERYLQGESIQARSSNVVDRLARVLQRSQFDREFHGFGNLLLWFAAVIGVFHVGKHFLIVNHEPRWTIVLIQVVQFALMGVVFRIYRPRQLLPQTLAERQMWAVWLGYIFSCVLVSTVVRAQYDFAMDERHELIGIPYHTVLAGFAFCVLGSSYWGRCYVFAAAFFVLAGVMVLTPRWSVLEYGALWCVVLVLTGLYLRRMERENRASAAEPTGVSSPPSR